MDTVNRAQKLFEEYGGISNLQDTLSKALPVEEDVPSIINQLQGIANARGVVIDSLDLNLLPVSSKEQSDALRAVGKVEIDMTVLGKYDGIKQYLDGLETNVRIMDVKDLTIDGGAGDTDILKYEIVITAYYQV
jgi:Tfp pilus assembly protein PilO